MATIRVNCRERFSTDDLEFIAASVGSQSSSLNLQSLLADPDALDAALESDRLLKSVLELPGNVSVTPRFYFYVLTRHMLPQFDRSVADYVASVLALFVDAQNHGAPGGHALPHISDMLIALKSASSEREFLIRVQVGDYALFLSGVFPQRIQNRATHHASPPISFYEEVGSQNYRRASNHRLAREQSLVETYRTIAERFSEVRHGLNQMSDRLLCLEP
jgi:hypothetical protein